MKPKKKTPERCALCNCVVHRDGDYGLSSVRGRSHATRHHVVAERFFGRSRNRRGTQRSPILSSCPWGFERHTVVFCYECHEELIHNPVFLPEDVAGLATLIRRYRLNETRKPTNFKCWAFRCFLIRSGS
jgi:hypothetical protein